MDKIQKETEESQETEKPETEKAETEADDFDDFDPRADISVDAKPVTEDAPVRFGISSEQNLIK